MSTSARRWAIGVVLALAGGAIAVYAWRAVQSSDWAEPVVHYIILDGLPGTLRVSAVAVVGSALIGVTLGTLLTIKFLPLQALIRLYIEVFRGLPILVTVFIVYFGLPSVSRGLEFGRRSSPPRSRSSSGGARRSPRRRGVPSSRSRASSTRRRRRSGSAGSAGTGT